jgi:transposase
VKQVAETVSVSRQTVHNWLKDFLLRGIESAAYGRPTGRKPKLTKTQKNRRVELVKAGAWRRDISASAGHPSWSSSSLCESLACSTIGTTCVSCFTI